MAEFNEKCFNNKKKCCGCCLYISRLFNIDCSSKIFNRSEISNWWNVSFDESSAGFNFSNTLRATVSPLDHRDLSATALNPLTAVPHDFVTPYPFLLMWESLCSAKEWPRWAATIQQCSYDVKMIVIVERETEGICKYNTEHNHKKDNCL